eukprot:11119041-Alexandrium_andersonii.AAC.1
MLGPGLVFALTGPMRCLRLAPIVTVVVGLGVHQSSGASYRVTTVKRLVYAVEGGLQFASCR